MWRWLDFCSRRQSNPYQPTVSQVFHFLYTLHESGAIETHQKAIGAIVSDSVYEMNLSPETFGTKVHQDMRCYQGIVLYGKSWSKWLPQFGATDIENHQILYRAYVKDKILCPVKCIYAHLTKRSKIVTQDFTEFLITFGKAHHPAPERFLARWVKEVMGNSGKDAKTVKPYSSGVASNCAAYKYGILLQKVLKRGQWSNAGTFLAYYFRQIEESLDLHDKQLTWWKIWCIIVLNFINVIVKWENI